MALGKVCVVGCVLRQDSVFSACVFVLVMRTDFYFNKILMKNFYAIQQNQFSHKLLAGGETPQPDSGEAAA